MKKPGRPPSQFKTEIHPIDELTDRDDEDVDIDDAMDTLAKAESIKANPKIMGHVHAASGKKIKSLKSLRALARKKSSERPF